MQWSDEGFLLSKNNFNENSILIEAFTFEHGKYTGIVYGGSSRKQKKNFQAGNKILLNWKSKNENRTGYFNVELLDPIAPFFFDNKKKSGCLLSATSILKILLPERETNKKIYDSFEKMLSRGSIKTNIEINFSDDGKIEENYKVEGIVKGAEIRLFNNDVISNIDLNFDFKEKIYSFKNNKVEYKGIKLLAPKIKVRDSNKFFLVEGNVNSQNINFDDEKLSIFIKKGLENLDFKNLKISSENDFSFKINKKFRISDLKVQSKIDLYSLDFKIDHAKIKDYLPRFDGSIKFENHKIQLAFKENQLSIKGMGNYVIGQENEKINYEISTINKNFNFKSKININKNPLNINLFDYKKEENKNATLSIEGEYKKNKSIFFKKIIFNQSKNNFLVNDLSLTKDLKINYISSLNLDLLNKNKKSNKIYLKKNKKNYVITSKIFDGSVLLDEILTGENENGISRFFNNLNSDIKIDIDKVFISNVDFLSNFKSDIKLKKNNLTNLNLSGNFDNNKKLSLSIRTNQHNEKITTLFSENAKPLVKKYKFIKGFDEGSLDFYSIKKNNLSKSKLKINNFKLKELPALTKILTLASLQGIADLLTGEGIRFDIFEMDFHNKKNLLTIDEIYAIGPAISILMEGYVQDKDLVSLRGTLVPATTINKFVGSIPVLGKILVGKKTGEGVFGVSFKIKGHPKKLKTTVNPIKTLTPRFITRTLEKIKKSEKKD